MFDPADVRQTELLMRCLPEVAMHPCFALKGGTAINFFLRDMPRLSVDIDLTYLPLKARNESFMEIQDAMLAIRTGILKRISGSRATVSSADGYVVKLLVNVEGVRLKIEPNTTLRGSVYESRMMDLSRAAKEWSQMSLSMRVLSFEDLYGGKLCATLDRQHPRDLFDVKLLLDDTGITPAIRRAFVVYLAGHNRPMNELLDPRIKDIRDTFARQFSGMARIDMSLEDLKEVQRSLAPMLVQSLDDDEKRFLVSLKQGEPEWDLLGIDGLARFPAIQRKLLNVGRMDPKAHASALEKLKRILGV